MAPLLRAGFCSALSILSLALTSLTGGQAFAASEIYSQDVKISYALLQELLAANLDQALGAFVRRENCDKVKVGEYNCGEIPFGKIVDAQKKIVFTIPKQDFDGKQGSVSYDLKGKAIPIYLYRNQRKGEISMSLLDSRKVETVATTARLGDDLYLRLAPGGGNLTQDICINVPGMRGYTENVTMEGKLKKKIPILPDVKAKLKVKVSIGQFDFDNAKICMQLLTEMDAKGLPRISLVKMSTPTFYGLKHSGLKIDADADVGGFWGFIGGFLKWFGVDLEKTIASEVQKEVKKQAAREISVTTADVRSGKWFKSYIDTAAVSKMTSRLSVELRSKLKDNGWGKVQVDQALQASCLASVLKMGLAGSELKDVLLLCMLSPKIQVQFFLKDAENLARGCYSHSFDMRRVKDSSGDRKWYLSSCELVNRVSVTVDSRLEGLSQCLLGAFSERRNPSEVCAADIGAFALDFEAGRFDSLIGQIKSTKPVRPSDLQLEQLRRVAAERLGVALPPVSVLRGLWY